MASVSRLLHDIQDDYRRHDSQLTNLAFWAMVTYRYGRWCLGFRGPWGWITSKVYGLLFLWVRMTSAIELHREVRSGVGLHLVHAGNIKVHPRTVIGDRCGLMHDVTLGTVPEKEGAPTIGNDVFIGAGAKVLGPITLGDRARVGANSVVLVNVPAGATAIGVPARIIQFTGRAGEPPAAAPS
jgi:serine O-acetyltransferase